MHARAYYDGRNSDCMAVSLDCPGACSNLRYQCWIIVDEELICFPTSPFGNISAKMIPLCDNEMQK